MRTFFVTFSLLICAVILTYVLGCFYSYFYPLKYQDEISVVSAKYDVDKALIASVINVESGYNENAISQKGARGLMQIMPSTAEWLSNNKLIQYFIDDQSVEERIAAGKIPPLKDITVTDPINQEILDLVSNAEYVQLWYDQYFTAEVANAFLDANQAAYALEMTPEEAATVLQDKYQEYLNE